jgi:flagellar hook assembly protein FlgD
MTSHVACAVTPNPAQGPVNIEYCTEEAGNAKVVICDLTGRQVAELIDRVEPSGRHYLTWNGRDQQGRQVGSGIYFATIRTVSGVACRKFEYVRE